jgi:hypothetical protein
MTIMASPTKQPPSSPWEIFVSRSCHLRSISTANLRHHHSPKFLRIRFPNAKFCRPTCGNREWRGVTFAQVNKWAYQAARVGRPRETVVGEWDIARGIGSVRAQRAGVSLGSSGIRTRRSGAGPPPWSGCSEASMCRRVSGRRRTLSCDDVLGVAGSRHKAHDPERRPRICSATPTRRQTPTTHRQSCLTDSHPNSKPPPLPAECTHMHEWSRSFQSPSAAEVRASLPQPHPTGRRHASQSSVWPRRHTLTRQEGGTPRKAETRTWRDTVIYAARPGWATGGRCVGVTRFEVWRLAL